jgi:hypothetical protein
MFIKPNQGIKIRDPFTRTFLPDDGGNVENTPFWARRLRDGDVTLVQTESDSKTAVKGNKK